MKSVAIVFTALSLLSGCSTTGGQILSDGETSLTAGKAVVAFSMQVTDGTTYDNCSVFIGRSAASAQWFAWPVSGDDVSIIALEVEPGEYGFHRFGCMFRGLQLSTSVSGPQLSIAANDVVYLGRLVISDTGMGSAAGYSRMPTSVGLTFDDQRDEDLEALGRKWPIIEERTPNVSVPNGWNDDSRYPLRPYQDGVKLVAAPVI